MIKYKVLATPISPEEDWGDVETYSFTCKTREDAPVLKEKALKLWEKRNNIRDGIGLPYICVGSYWASAKGGYMFHVSWSRSFGAPLFLEFHMYEIDTHGIIVSD